MLRVFLWNMWYLQIWPNHQAFICRNLADQASICRNLAEAIHQNQSIDEMMTSWSNYQPFLKGKILYQPSFHCNAILHGMFRVCLWNMWNLQIWPNHQASKCRNLAGAIALTAAGRWQANPRNLLDQYPSSDGSWLHQFTKTNLLMECWPVEATINLF